MTKKMCDKKDESIAKCTAERNAMVLFVPEKQCLWNNTSCTDCYHLHTRGYCVRWNANYISICFMWYVQQCIVGSGKLPPPTKQNVHDFLRVFFLGKFG